MNMRRFIMCTFVVASSAALPATGFAACDARSGPKTAVLVELYTSEGCSSCPPADQQLRRLRQVLDPTAEVVPLALHVGYWNYVGWKDPYAQASFGERQSWLVHANQRNTVYTPQFFVSGSELRSWEGGLREKVRQLNALPAPAAVRVQANIAPNGTLVLNAEATARGEVEPAALYLALAESGLVSPRPWNSSRGLATPFLMRKFMTLWARRSESLRLKSWVPVSSAWPSTETRLIC